MDQGPRVASLLSELSVLCDASCASTSIEHLIHEACQLLRLESVPETVEKLTDRDRELVISFLQRKRQQQQRKATEANGGAEVVIAKPVSQKLFLPMNRVITEVEKDLVLIKPLQNLLNLKGSSIGSIGGVEQQKVSKALRKGNDQLSAKEACTELAQFLNNVLSSGHEGSELKTHLVIVKLLLCLLETDEKTFGNFEATSLRLPRRVLQSLSSPSILSRHSLDRYLYIEREKERLQTFEACPRLLACSGSPGKLSALEVQGSAVGFLTSIRLDASAGERYYEVTLKGTIRGGIRLGWMRTGSNLDAGGAAVLGDSAKCAVFDGQTGFFFHNALAMRSPPVVSSAAGSSATPAAAAVPADAPGEAVTVAEAVHSVSAKESARLARFDQLLSFGIDRTAVLRMMLQDGIPKVEAEQLLSSRAATAAAEDFDENVDGIASLLGRRMTKSFSAIRDISAAVMAGGSYLVDSDSYNWSAGSVLGCYINSSTGAVRFFVNGAEVGQSSLSIAALLDGGRSVCPVFSCSDSAGLEFNIGQMPFVYPHPTAACISPAGEPRTTEQVRSYYLHLEPDASKAEVATGIVVSRVSSERLKGFTMEMSLRLTEAGFLLQADEAATSAGPARRCLLSSTTVSSTVISLGCSVLVDRQGSLIFEVEGQEDTKTPPGIIQHNVWRHLCVIYPTRGPGHPRELLVLIDGVIVHRAEIPEHRQAFDKVRFCSLCVGGQLQVSSPPSAVAEAAAAGMFVCVYDVQANSEAASSAASAEFDTSPGAISKLRENYNKAWDGAYTMTEVLAVWIDRATLGSDAGRGKVYYRFQVEGSSTSLYWNADVTYSRRSRAWRYISGSGIEASAAFNGMPPSSVLTPPPATPAAPAPAPAPALGHATTPDTVATPTFATPPAFATPPVFETPPAAGAALPSPQADDKAAALPSTPSTPSQALSNPSGGGRPDGEPARSRSRHSDSPARQTETIANSASTRSFVGDVCEVRLWAGAKSVEGVAASLGRSRVSGVEPNLLLLLPFEEGSGSTIHDAAFSNGVIRSASGVTVLGSFKWRHHGSGFLRDVRYRPPPGSSPASSDLTKTLFADTLPHLKGIVGETDGGEEPGGGDVVRGEASVDSDAQVDVNIAQILAAVVRKFALSSDRFIETESPSQRDKTWYRQIQDGLPSTLSIAQPYVLNFLMLNSLLRQLIRMSRARAAMPADAASAILRSLSLALLRVLRVNFLDVASNGLSPAQLGLQYSRLPEGGQKTAFVSKLLITLLYFVSDDEHSEHGAKATAQPSSLCVEAVGAIIAAFHIFFPHSYDQVFLLICLLSKKFRHDPELLAQSAPPDLVQALSSPRGVPVGPDDALPSDPFLALLAVSKTGDEVLLRASCELLSVYSNAAKLVPPEARPVMLPAFSDVLTRQPGLEPVHSDLVAPRVGDIVCRGPHWQYGNQDGGADKIGVVVEVVDWEGAQRGLRVRWGTLGDGGALNVYRWGVVEAESPVAAGGAGGPGGVAIVGAPKYDVSLLRAATSAVVRLSPSLVPIDDPALSGGSSAAAASQSSRDESGKRELLYTPEEINLSLVEEVGSLTKRTVLAYMQEIAPLAWQERHKLTWSLNTLVKNFTAESTAALYRTFYEAFSSKVAPPAANVASKTSLSSQRDEEGSTVQLGQLLGLLQRNAFDSPAEPVVDASDAGGKMASSPTLQLISYLQGQLVGVFPPTPSGQGSTPASEQRLGHVALSARLFDAPFPDGSGGQVMWNWRAGAWKSAVPAGATENKEAEASREVQYFRDVGFYDEELPDDLSLPTDYTVQHSGSRNKGFHTCRAYKKMEPDSGIYRWYVRIENFGLGKRGNIIIGLATASSNSDAYLGQDGESWGLSCSKELFHKGRPVRSDFGHRISSGTQLELTLDTFAGTLTIRDVRKDAGSNIEPAFTSREGLRGKTLYPAFSLYNPGDCLSVLASLDYDQVSTSRAPPVPVPVVAVSMGVPVGAPSALLVKFLLQTLQTTSGLLRAGHASIRSPQVSVCLVQLLGSLCRWQIVPIQHLRAAYCALSDFTSTLRGALESALLEERQAADDSRAEVPCSYLLRQLACIVAAYMGRLNAAMIVCDGSRSVDNRFVLSAMRVESAKMLPVAVLSAAADATALVVGPDVHAALSSKLFAFGLKPRGPESAVTWADLQDWTGEAVVLWRWLAKHDRMEAERKVGDATLTQTVKHFFFVVCHHSGLLSLAISICRQVEELGSAEVAAFVEAHKPPSLLLNAWKIAVQIKMEAMKIKQSRGTQYPLLAQCMSARLSFLFELEQSVADQILSISHGTQALPSLLEDLAKGSSAHGKVVADVALSVRLFVTHEQCLNTSSIALLRAALKGVEETALLRADAMYFLRGSLEVLGSDFLFGWAAKCALLLHFPSAMRNEGKNLLARSTVTPLLRRMFRQCSPAQTLDVSPVSVPENSGHYLFCLDGCNKADKMRLRGAFDTLYTYIANELGSDDVEPAVQLCLINCLGVRILEDDHAMISRVNIFYAIHELLTAALTAEGDQPDTSQHLELAKLTKAAMKLFILLTLQVAASGEKTNRVSSRHLEAPVTYKVKSGPATLSTHVFDILYKQLSVLASMLRADVAVVAALGSAHCKFDPSAKDKQPMLLPHVEVSEDVMVVLSEATALLLHLASHEVCQRLLARPKWIALLVSLLDASPTLCQQRVLLLLFDLLPACAVADLHSPEYADKFSFCARLPGRDVSQKIVKRLIGMCGKAAMTVDLDEPFVVSKGAGLVTTFSSVAVPQASECVAIVRKLLASPAWSALVEAELLEAVSAPITNELLMDRTGICDMAATLFVLGGHVDTEYVDCPVATDTEEQSGVIVSIVLGTDNVEVAPNSASLLVKEMPLDRVRLLNRFPIDSLDVSPALVEAVLRLADTLLFDPAVSDLTQTPASSPRSQEEEKTELRLEEEKSDAVAKSAQAGRDELQARKFNLAALRCACSKVLVGLSTNPRSLECMQAVLSDGASSGPFLRNLLASSIVCTRSGGVADIPIFESYLALVLGERRRVLATTKVSEGLLRFQAEMAAHEALGAASRAQAAGAGVEAADSSAREAPAGEQPNAAASEAPPVIPPPPAADEPSGALGWPQSLLKRADLQPAPGGIGAQHPYNGGSSDGGPSGPGTMSVGSGEGEEEDLDMNEMADGDDNEQDEQDEQDEDEDEDEEEEGDQGEVEAGILESLTNMGFPKRWCEIALEMCGGEVDEALNYILSNGDQLEAVVAAEQAGTSRFRGGEGEEEVLMDRGQFSGAGQEEHERDEEDDEEDDFMRQIHENVESVARIKSIMDSRRSHLRVHGGGEVPLTSRELHYDDRLDKLSALYAEPTTSSERVGSAFPGDTVRALDEFVNPLDPYDHWYKVNLADYRDEPQSDEEEPPGEALAWAQRYINGTEVILAGLETGNSGDLADPPSESWRIDRVYRVTGARGAMVRTGVETTSDEITVLNAGDTARAVEETFNSDGNLRLRIVDPVCGWISKLPSLLSKVSERAVDEDKQGAEVVSDWSNLEGIEDDMEVWGGNDIYRRDERFFKSLQGSHYQRCKDSNRTKVYSMHHRRLRVMGSSGSAACAQALSLKTADALTGIYLSAAQTLTNLNCRKAFLAVVIRSTKEKEGSSLLLPDAYPLVRQLSAPLQPRESLPVAPIPPLVLHLVPAAAPVSSQRPVDDARAAHVRAEGLIASLAGVSLQSRKAKAGADEADPARAAFNFYSLLRLVVFRGQPHSCTGLEWLALSEIDAVAMAVGKMSRSLDEIMFPLVTSLLKRDNYAPQQEAFRSALLIFFLSSIAYDIWQACSGGQVEQSWDDSSYEDLLDDGSMQQANMHYCQWITALLLHMDLPEVTFVVFRAWAVGLRGTSMSLKRIAFDQLSHILTSFPRDHDMRRPDCQDTLRALLAHLPVQRLTVIGSRRLWYELEDSPAYSRYLQRLLHFLSVIQTSEALLPRGEDAAAIEPGPGLAKAPADAQPEAAAQVEADPAHPTVRPVLNFTSPKSFVQLNPPKDLTGSWTVEMWIKREVPPFDVDVTSSDGDAPQSPRSDRADRADRADRSRVDPPLSGFGGSFFGRKAFMRFTEGRDESREEHEAARRGLQEYDFAAGSGIPVVSPHGDPSEGPGAFGGSAYSQPFGGHPGGPGGSLLRPGSAGAGFGSTMAALGAVPMSAFGAGFLGLRDYNAAAGAAGGAPAFGGSPFAAQLAAGSAAAPSRESELAFFRPAPPAPAAPAAPAAPSAAIPAPPAVPPPVTLPELVASSSPVASAPAASSETPPAAPDAADTPAPIVAPTEPEKPHQHAPAIYLLSSRDWHLKLQAGGRVFGLGEDEDPTQASDPVAERALCVSVGSRDPRNPPERAFDYIVPTGRWVHLAIVCKSSGQSQSSSTTLTLYADGVPQDTISTKFSLPISMVGSTRKGQSFFGNMAEMRVWSCVRSAGEIRRDMLTDVSGGKFLRHGLIAHLRCNEGSGSRTFDGAGMINTCKLQAVEWAHVGGPAMKPHAVSQALLGETEDNSSILGDSDRSENDMVEMTGVLRRGPFHASPDLANPSSEVVCLCYRYLSPEGEAVRQLEGYLDWCERSVRCCLTGSHDSATGALTFSVKPVAEGVLGSSEGSIVTLGPPESLSWMRGLTFTGSLRDEGLKGHLQLLCAAPAQPPLPAGQTRFDKLGIPGRCNYKKGPRGASGPTEVLTLQTEGPPGSGGAVATIELRGYGSTDPAERVRGADGAESVDSSPFYGLVEGDGCAWVEWVINKTGGETVFGACLPGAWEASAEGAERDRRTWLYTITGTITHAGETVHTEPCGDGDSVSIHFDMVRGVLSFFRNCDLLHEFEGINALEAVARSPDTAQGSAAALCASLPNAQRGLRPFVSLVSFGDSVSYRGLREGAVVVQYPESDPLGRSSYTGSLHLGCLHGKGVLRFVDTTFYWYGHWSAGLQDGVQLRIRVDPATLTESIESVHVYHEGADVCDLTDSQEDLPEVTSWRAEAIASSISRTSSGEKAAAAAAAAAASAASAAGAGAATPASAAGVGSPGSEPGGDRAMVLPAGGRSPSAALSASPRSSPAAALRSGSGDRAANPPRREDVTIKIRDAHGADLHLKMNRNVRLQKAFELYASKRSVPVSTLEFLLDGEAIRGDNTPDSLDFGENEMIEVAVDGELRRLLRSSTAPYIIKIIYKDGATVRTGVEIEETSTGRHMQHGETAEAYFRTETKEGIGRFLVADDPTQRLPNTHGWISERLRGTNEEKVTIILRELYAKPVKYAVIKADGAKWRHGAAMDSEDGGMIPEGTVVEVAEMRVVRNLDAAAGLAVQAAAAASQIAAGLGAPPTMGPLAQGLGLGGEAELVRRLRIVSPPEFVGWISCKDHITRPVDPPPTKKPDPDVLREAARRAQIRMQRLIRARAPTARRDGVATVDGSLDVTSENLFLLNGTQRSSGVAVSSDFKTVTVSPHAQRDRAMALGSRGFSRGVHYWEVQINSVQNGNVFVGVAPAEYVQQWGGYGFVNYRVKVSLTNDETLYGRWTNPGDVIGVLLDMTAGTLSFFHDGPEPFSDSSKVRNMGVSHRYLRRASGSRYPVLYPCFGLKMAGDSISIRKCKWISRKGADAPELYSQLMHAKSVVSHWRNTYLPPGTHPLAGGSLSGALASRPRGGEPLPPHVLHDMYAGYQSSCVQKRYVYSRPGLQVGLFVDEAAIERACGPELTAKFRIRLNRKFTSRYGAGHIVGARGRQLWYMLDLADAGDVGAWYWGDELEDLIAKGFVTFDTSAETGAAAGGAAAGALPRSATTTPPSSPGHGGSRLSAGAAVPLLALEDFSTRAFPELSKRDGSSAARSAVGGAGSSGSAWSMEEDVALCSAVNEYADKFGEDPCRLYPDQLDAFRLQTGVLPRRSSEEVRCRYAALCVLNKAAELVLPVCDFGAENSVGGVQGVTVLTDYERELRARFYPSYLYTGRFSSQALLDVKRVLFLRTKLKFWTLLLKESTTNTSEPPDEFDRPSDIKEILLNRLVARSLLDRKESTPFAERLRRSVFGQLMEALGSWDDSFLRRAYQHFTDASQARAFFVKFEGEGSDDLGGPYRAVFNTVTEEAQELLDLLVLCPNGASNDFQNRDKMLFNTRLTQTLPPDSLLYVFFGKAIAIACRHGIQLSLSLPGAIWKPLLGEAVGMADLRDIDTRTSTFLIEHGGGQLPRADRDGEGGAEVAHNASSTGSTAAESGETLADLMSNMLTSLQGTNAALTPSAIRRITDCLGPPQAADGPALPAHPEAARKVCLLVEHLQLMSQNDGISQLFRGLDAVLPTEVFPIFSPAELEVVFCGAANIDVDVLKSATVYEGVSPFDPHIVFFWEALEAMTQEERSKLINFCSGRSRLPASASSFTMSFKLAKPPPEAQERPDNYLPKASTCFFTLYLPQYTSLEVCLDKLKYAISNTDVMDADLLLHDAIGWGSVF